MSKEETIKEIIKILEMQKYRDGWTGNIPFSNREYAEMIYNKFLKKEK